MNDVRMFEEMADGNDGCDGVQRVREPMSPIAFRKSSSCGGYFLLALRLGRSRASGRPASIDLLPLFLELPAAGRRHCDKL